MYKRLAIWALAVLFSASLFGCATLKDYKPKSKEEAAIKDVLVTFSCSQRRRGTYKGFHLSYMETSRVQWEGSVLY